MFFGGYFIYGLVMSAGGGKLEPIVDCLFLMSLVLWKENQRGKSMFTLGLAVQTKIYPIVAFPVFFLISPVSIVWFLASMFLTVVPVFMGASFDSLVSHMLNLSSYSPYIVNPMYPGLAIGTPILNSPISESYIWFPALIPLVIYLFFMLATVRQFLPSKAEFSDKSFMDKFRSLIPLYLYSFPFILFFMFRWVMPWYLYWLGPVVLLFKKNSHSLAYMKQLALIGLLYLLGMIVNWPYFISGPIPEFVKHFPWEWNSIYGFILLGALAAVAFVIWRWTFDRREQRAELYRAAEARGELII
jgi:hypothetical protein